MLTKEELDQINRFSKAELTADQVYTFSVRLCDNEVDRDGERFEPETLEELAGLFVGKCGIFDHQWSAKGQAARIYRTELVRENGKYYVTPLGSRIEVDGETGENLAAKAVDGRSVVLGVRPEHITLSQPGPHAIPCTIIVNEMMGSELHIHAKTEDGAQLVVRVPTLGLRRQERAELVNGAKIHVSFPGEVMHLFDPETERNLIYG